MITAAAHAVSNSHDATCIYSLYLSSTFLVLGQTSCACSAYLLIHQVIPNKSSLSGLVCRLNDTWWGGLEEDRYFDINISSLSSEQCTKFALISFIWGVIEIEGLNIWLIHGAEIKKETSLI